MATVQTSIAPPRHMDIEWFRRGFIVAIDDSQAGTRRRECLGAGAADAARPAGNDHLLSGERSGRAHDPVAPGSSLMYRISSPSKPAFS